jgi:uncharacterized protein (DUF1501 family)
MMTERDHDTVPTTCALGRRGVLARGALGVGALALAGLFDGQVWARARPRAPAKRIIFLFMAGGPSQLDLFCPKPRLAAATGQPLPESLARGERFAFIKGVPRLLGSPFAFRRHGASGATLSTLLPHTARVVDRLTFLHAVESTQVNHAPAQIYMNTGHHLAGRPSLGSWLGYGLGALNRDLPAFVVMLSGESHPDGGRALWSNGFLATDHQGVELWPRGDPVLFLSDPPGVSRAARRDSLDTLAALNRRRLRATGDPQIAARVRNYELAFRMQAAVPELADLGRESAATHARYGTTPRRPSFANHCLLARRLVERGVRVVQLYHRGWDTHGVNRSDDLLHRLPALCRETDQATAALIEDLDARGLLESTLVVWGGEFGRTPMIEARDGSMFLGRDHHRRAFTMWLAGGGIRPGVALGASDELGFAPASDPVTVHDLHATLLDRLGLDHTALTFSHQGRRFRLTDVAGRVVRQLVA